MRTNLITPCVYCLAFLVFACILCQGCKKDGKEFHPAETALDMRKYLIRKKLWSKSSLSNFIRSSEDTENTRKWAMANFVKKLSLKTVLDYILENERELGVYQVSLLLSSISFSIPQRDISAVFCASEDDGDVETLEHFGEYLCKTKLLIDTILDGMSATIAKSAQHDVEHKHYMKYLQIEADKRAERLQQDLTLLELVEDPRIPNQFVAKFFIKCKERSIYTEIIKKSSQSQLKVYKKALETKKNLQKYKYHIVCFFLMKFDTVFDDNTEWTSGMLFQAILDAAKFKQNEKLTHKMTLAIEKMKHSREGRHELSAVCRRLSGQIPPHRQGLLNLMLDASHDNFAKLISRQR